MEYDRSDSFTFDFEPNFRFRLRWAAAPPPSDFKTSQHKLSYASKNIPCDAIASSPPPPPHPPSKRVVDLRNLLHIHVNVL